MEAHGRSLCGMAQNNRVSPNFVPLLKREYLRFEEGSDANRVAAE